MNRFALLLSGAFCCCLAMAGNGFVSLKDTSKLFFVRNNEFYSPDKQTLLYFQKGNIFYSGISDEKQNIFLLTTSMDPASEKLQEIYEKDERQPSYTFSNNKFYLGKNESDDTRAKNELIHVERAKKWMAFYSSYNDSLLAYYPADSIPASTTILVAYTLVTKFDLGKKAIVQQNTLPFQNSEFSSIKPTWGNTTANEWIWDGKILRPRWNIDAKLMWTFDGQIIKQQYENNTDEQYSWDGENFKPLWKTNRNREWTYDGRLIKPMWETDWSNQYVIEDGIVKPWSNVHTEKEWHLDGNIPIPLIILIISGIAHAN